jgi:hypothetical protein
MSGIQPDDTHDRRVEEIVRIASETADDDLLDLPPQAILRIIMGPGRDPDEGGASIAVPAPHKPNPHDSSIALPLPTEDEREA